jgi:hypothetical protein
MAIPYVGYGSRLAFPLAARQRQSQDERPKKRFNSKGNRIFLNLGMPGKIADFRRF